MSAQSLEESFRSSDAEIRRQSIAHARMLTEESVLDLLFLGLADADWRVRKEAVAALRERDTDVRMVERMAQALLPGDNVGLRNAAVQALGAHGDVAVTSLQRMAPRLDGDGLKLALEVLALTRSPRAMPLLRELGAHDDPNVRAAAIEAVAHVGRAAPEEASAFLDEALEQPDRFLKLVTLDVVRRLGFAPSWDRLRALLSDPVLTPTALELAARMDEPRAAPYLVRELERALGSASSAQPLETEARALRYAARFMDGSEDTLEAARAALGGLSQAARDRLFALCGSRENREVAQDALLVLAADGEGRAAAVAVSMLDEESASASVHRAIELLGVAASTALLGRLEASEPRQRALAVRLLAGIAGDEQAPAVVLERLRALDDPATEVRIAWVDAMVGLGDADGLERVIRRFDEEAPTSLRRSVAAAARELADKHPDRARRLSLDDLSSGARAECRCWFLSVLAEPLASPTADLEFLVATASSPSVTARVAALAALSRRRDLAALEAIAFALSDEAAEVQFAAVRSLGEFRTAEKEAAGTPHLVEFAEAAHEVLLSLEALRALGQTGDARALDYLLERLSAPSAVVAMAAVSALSGFAPKLRARALTRALSHPEPEVVKAAMQALADHDEIPEHEVMRCLSHPVWDVRRLAADVLGEHLTVSARDALARQMSTEGESSVREAIVRSLARYEAPGSLKTIPPPGDWKGE